MMFRYDHDMGGWDYAWMSIGMLVFWVLLLVALALVVRFAVSGGSVRADQAPPTAEDLLAQRFARGELDQQEYLTRLDVLHGHRP